MDASRVISEGMDLFLERCQSYYFKSKLSIGYSILQYV